jgi:hypothetical protein
MRPDPIFPNDKFVSMDRKGHPIGRYKTQRRISSICVIFMPAPMRPAIRWSSNGSPRQQSSGKSPFGSGTSRWRRTPCPIPILRSSFPECGPPARHCEGIRLLPLPPPVEIEVHTHPRFVSNMGIGWFRDTLVATFKNALEVTKNERFT